MTRRIIVSIWALTLLFAVRGASAQTPIAAGFRDFSYGSVLTTPTGEKPESKLWWNDGVWWGSLFSTAAQQYHIYRFDTSTQSWADTGTVLDPRTNSRADVLWDETSQKLYVASHTFTSNAQPTSSTSQWGRLYRYSYDTSGHSYSLDAGFPVTITQGKTEALTIAKDTAARLWVTYVEAGRVKVNHSVSNDLDWGAPTNLPGTAAATTVSSDDISAIVAFGTDRIGVMWSNQLTNKTYFAYRRDLDAAGVWQPEETALPGAGCSGNCSDDHLNLKADRTGRVLAAVKSSLTSSAQPLTLLAVRETTGIWTSYTFGRQGEHHTRPIVLLDEDANRLYYFATNPESDGAVYYKTSPLDQIAFPSGVGTPFIKSTTDLSINNATSTKQGVSAATGLLVVAGDADAHFYFHNFLPLGGSPPPVVNSFSPTSGAVGQSVTVTGTGFTGATSVKFGATSAAFVVNSGTSIGTTVPAGAVSGPISVTTPSGTGVSATSFTVTGGGGGGGAPVVSSFSPTSGPVGQAVQVTGSAFTGATAVKFGGVAASFVVTSNTRIDTTVPAGAATGPISVTTPSGTGASPASFTVTGGGGGGSSIKDITFEGGSLTDPGTGADRVIGTVSLESSAPIKGVYSAVVPNASNAYLEENFTAADDLFVSLYVRVNALPTSDNRILQISNAGVTVGNVYLRVNGSLRLRVGSTTIGADTAPLAVGQVYRIGIHQKTGTSGNAVLEAFVAVGDAAFAAPFASTTTGTWTTAADRLRVGATVAVPVNLAVDDLRLNGAVMPPPTP
jgi:hypothetical protein